MDPWIYFWLKAHFFIHPCKNDPHIGVLAAFSGALAGLVAILVVLFFTGFLYYLPEPILAVLIIAAVINMVDFRGFLRIWSVGRITG
jgi:SulP family sulfate permease